MKRARGPFLLACASAFVGAGGCSDLTGGSSEVVRAEVGIDLSALRAGANGAVSVADRVVLTATPASGAGQRIEQPLGPGAFEALVPVTVREGRVSFGLEILNRAGTVLFSGSSSEEVATDGFVLDIELAARAPFLVVSPDTVGGGVEAASFGYMEDRIEVANPGLASLSWSIPRAEPPAGGLPPLVLCDGLIPQPCLLLSSTSGRLGAQGREPVAFRATSAEAQTYRLLVTSNVGEVEVAMTVPAALSGRGTAVIDGTLAAGEWNAAAAIDLPLNLPGGSTAPARLRIMSDDRNLYLSLAFGRTREQWRSDRYALVVDFDNDADGAAQQGDDAFVAQVLEPGQLERISRPLADYYRPEQKCRAVTCLRPDFLGDGSNEGVSAAGNDGSQTVIEISKPLRSGDTRHDFSLGPQRMVGFLLAMFFLNSQSPVPTVWPASGIWAVFLVR